MKTNMLIIFFILSCIFSSLAQASPIQNQVVQIAAGPYHSLVLKEDGTVWAWGLNNNGQLGDGTTANISKPVQVSGLSHVTMLTAGYHSLSLKEDGTVWAWGYNNWGQLGDGTTINRYRPVQVSDLSNVIMISAGEYHSLALKGDGSVWAWGYNGHGELGFGTTTDKKDLNRSLDFQILSRLLLESIIVWLYKMMVLSGHGD
ncbi:MAG: Regulator of chromosome condensation, RCC1 [Candidatus Magnetoglobus multicellularis str. Araruama]|uniref:Regulator of chromosome condensation, RCC1 n=1 Tax=Candidatus Magnetoglobus multicellularis str. Araruama TaxID=890399 RepID=A0A1V1PBQ6_9BACT|nr:MAG: Regulator of chromosome condensation, RCC1 [Candidatus Magnetoglobus multicellularis str. Araruama]